MDASNPAGVAADLGEIEDALHQDQAEHASLNGKVKRTEKFFETYLKVLYEGIAEYDNPTDRMRQAEAQLHETDLYAEYLDDLEALEEFRKRFEYHDVRRSIGQSLLKLFEHDHGRHGQGARGQSGQ